MPRDWGYVLLTGGGENHSPSRANNCSSVIDPSAFPLANRAMNASLSSSEEVKVCNNF